MKFFRIPLPIIAAAALAACGAPDPIADPAENTDALPPPPTVNATDPSGAAPPANTAAAPAPDDGGADPQPAAPIPAAFHGRWGLTPADCTSTRGDAKGLLEVEDGALRFYESRAVPVANVQSGGDSFSADFAFRGEGMKWRKFQTLQIQDGNLVRTESTPMASYTYARCR